MTETARLITCAVVAVVGLLIGYRVAETAHPDAAPVTVVSDEAVRALTRALEAQPPPAQQTPAQRELTDEANDLIDDIERGEVTVQPPTTVAPEPVEGGQGEPATTTTVPPTAQPGSIDLPLLPHGTVPPTTLVP